MSLDGDLKAWLPLAEKRARSFRPEPRLEHIGSVTKIGDGVVTVEGLPGAKLDELLAFDDGSKAIVLRVDESALGCVLLAGGEDLRAGARVQGTGDVLKVPVGEPLLGRIVDALGQPLDEGPAIEAGRFSTIDRPAPAIIDRDLVSQPLATGITAIDTMIPLGRGQRELIIGDRKTGKTAIAVDTIINQRDSDVICVYAAIGQKTASVNQLVEAVREHGAMDRCIFVIGASDALAGHQWITPYSACAMAEYFRDKGRDVLIVFDDLTHHAIIYRQLSLLLRRPPGREAYPGDIFYVHARLLERAAKLSRAKGGGSLTALPIAETQGGNLTAYVPTNLISITDGQIYLEPKLFYEGQKPAVNIGYSVSRVGGHAQAPAFKGLAETLKLKYTQFLELEIFARFGAIVDERTKAVLDHGRHIRTILRQPQYQPLSLAVEVALLLALDEGKLTAFDQNDTTRFKQKLAAELETHCPQVVTRINKTGLLGEEDRKALSAPVFDLVEKITAGHGATALAKDAGRSPGDAGNDGERA